MATNRRGQVPEEERCKGTSRQTKERCKRRRSPGSEFCIYHGGRAPKGGAHPIFKHGRRSRYMPSDIFKHFDRFVNDPKIAHHRESIAQIDVLIQEAWDDFENGGTAELWWRLKKSWRGVQKARAEGNAVRLQEAVNEVGDLIVRGAEQVNRHEKILKLLEQRRKHVQDPKTRKAITNDIAAIAGRADIDIR